MAKAFDQGKEEVAKLCRYFDTNRQAFLAPGVKEDHVRQSLIDPLFEALGWDVHNAAMAAPQYREVIPEDSLDVEGQQKAPDYTFRVGQLPKFYAEAKKCGVNISADPGPAYQLRRYGWSAKLALSVLTDFEELGVYDCTTRPRPSDKASHARIQYFRFDEYPGRWRELWDVFSREAVWSGAFDQYAASKRKRGTSEVDAEFLKEMEGWRLALASNIALRNKNLALDDLNAAVQLTIDRVVFLRMAEDRGLESNQQLLKLCERPDIYPRFMRDLCRRADQKYNSGLFHFQKESGVSEDPDRITPKLTVDDKVFKPILESLYFEHGSPYHFGVLPVEILGTVYERFLGKVIRLTAGHQAKVEEKPEVRKAGGVYYTPSYIVEYIVKHTVGRQIEARSPAQLAGLPRSASVPLAHRAAETAALHIRDRGHLPHWETEGGTYFVTFRLADSLPKSVLESFKFEREQIVRAAAQQERELTVAEQKRLDELSTERIETYLDSGAGACHLAKPEIAELVATALRHFDGDRYRLLAWCVMPNHVHVVFTPAPGQALQQILHSWKSYTAKKAIEVPRLRGAFWQREYYDHLVRDEADFYRVVNYVSDNPQKAHLKDWPWVWRIDTGSASVPLAHLPRSASVSASSRGRPEAGATFRVLDMACGSGSFLLGAYRCLLDHCLKWYSEHKPETCKKAVYKDPRNGHWRLTIEEKK